MTNKDRAKGRIGPHEGRELALMLAGLKPLAMFSDTVPASYDMPEDAFAPHVASGEILRREETYHRPDMAFPIRFVYFALCREAWRVEAIHRINETIFAGNKEANEDDERAIGRLLGYTDADIERYLVLFRQRRAV